MQYPESVMTKTKKGAPEVRTLIGRGKYVQYEYLDPNTKRRVENKVRLVLFKGKKTEEYFIIPLKGGRSLLIPAESKKGRSVWNGKKSIRI